MEADIVMRVIEDEPIKMKYIEASIKPEQTRTVTPTDDGFTVYPDEGSVLLSVVVNPIPEATEDINITANGDVDVRKKRTAHVNVQPNLTTATVTPTEQQQTVTAENADGLSAVTVEPIPSQYIVPSGSMDIVANANGINVAAKETVNVNVPIPPGYIVPSGTKNISENGTGIDVTEYSAVDVAVPQGVFPSGTKGITQNGTGIDVSSYQYVDVAVPVPTMPEEYCIGGSLYNKTLVKYHFPANATGDNLKQNQFNGCAQLEEFENFPSTATTILAGFASGATKLDMPSLPNGLASIGQNGFNGCAELSLTTLPNTLTSIGVNGFYGCTSLRLTALPSGLTSMGTSAFQYCSSITLSDVPAGITKISTGAFRGCTSIEALRFAGNITNIDRNAFNGCSSCIVYDFRNCTAVPTLSNADAFTNINANAKIVVLDSLVASWKAATNWVTYANYIIGVTDYDNS